MKNDQITTCHFDKDTTKRYTQLLNILLKALLYKADIYKTIGQWKQILDLYQKAESTARKLNNPVLLGKVFSHYCFCYTLLSDAQKVNDYAQKANDIFIEAKEYAELANLFNTQGMMCYQQGQIDQALELYQKSYKISKEIEDGVLLSKALGNLGRVYWAKSDFKKAEAYFIQYQIRKQALGDKNGYAIAVGNLGSLYASIGEEEKALDCFQKYLTLKKEMGDKQGIAIALSNLASNYSIAGEYQRSIGFYKNAMQIADELGSSYILQQHIDLANVYFEMKDYLLANEHNSRGLLIARKLGSKNYILMGSLLELKINYTLGDTNSLNSLIKMLDDHQKPENRANIFHALWDLTQNDEYRKKAVEIYTELFHKNPNASFKWMLKKLGALDDLH